METKNLILAITAAICTSILFISPAESVAPYNITKVLEEYAEYSQFNEVLTQSKLAEYINHRERVITLLVTRDVGSVSGKPLASMQAVLSLHVLLDYLDATKIRNMKRSVTFTTMFQETGIATGNQGYVNFTKTGGDNNQIMIGNGRRDAQLSVSFEKLVMTKAPVLAIVEVSGIIQAPWADSIKAPPPRSHKKKVAPTPSPADAPSPSRRRHRKVAPSSEAGSPPEPDEDPADAADADASSSAPAPAKSSGSSLSVAGGFAASMFVGLLASLMV